MIIASFLFALMGVAAKELSDKLSTIEIVFFRNVFGVFFILFSIYKSPLKQLGGKFWLLIFRGVAGFLALLFFFYNIANIPLGEAMTFSKTSTIFTALLAYFFLKEQIGIKGWIGVIVGFIGILFIAELMMGYETYLKEQGASMNTVSFYMRILRATYNRAVDKGVIRQRFPFKHVYTGVEKTVKRAISFKVIRQLKEMDLSHSQSMEFARDMFMFSFYTRGMSFVDMAFLKKTDLNNGMLTYRRKKTGQLLSIRWEKCMQDIVDKYPGNYSTYLLPIIIHIRKDERLQYKNSICLVNRRLKEIGKKLGLVHPLTMYVARHSWASVARGKHIPLSVIRNNIFTLLSQEFPQHHHIRFVYHGGIQCCQINQSRFFRIMSHCGHREAERGSGAEFAGRF
jgi:uncharacterized membrane protein